MDRSKNPRQAGWFSAKKTTEKPVGSFSTCWRQLRRRCALAQVASEANEKKKVDEKNEAFINRGNSGAENTYIYSGNFRRQERNRTSGLRLPDGMVIGRGTKKQQSTRQLALSKQLCNLPRVAHIIARLATNNQKFSDLTVHHPRPKQPKKFLFSELIRFTYIFKISGILVTNQEGIYYRYPKDFRRIFGKSIRDMCGIFSLSIPNFVLIYCNFQVWARAP